MTDLCSMCEVEPATTVWIFPVCQNCADGLNDTQEMLLEMEADDPELAEAGRKVEESWAKFVKVHRG